MINTVSLGFSEEINFVYLNLAEVYGPYMDAFTLDNV